MILALDLATTTGWCAGDAKVGVRPRIGSILLGKHGHGSIGAGLDDWLWGWHTLSPVSLLVVEAAIAHHSSIQSAKIALGLLMVCEVFAYRAEIPIKQCAATSVRARVVGSGRAKKPEVMAWCRTQGWEPPNTDAADAAALWELARRVKMGRDAFPT